MLLVKTYIITHVYPLMENAYLQGLFYIYFSDVDASDWLEMRTEGMEGWQLVATTVGTTIAVITIKDIIANWQGELNHISGVPRLVTPPPSPFSFES